MNKSEKPSWLKFLIKFNIAYAALFVIFLSTYKFFGMWLYQSLAPHCINSTNSECYLGVGWSLVIVVGYGFIGLVVLSFMTLILSLYIKIIKK